MNALVQPTARRGRSRLAAIGISALVLATAIGPSSAIAAPPDEGATLGHVGSFFVDDNLGPGEPISTPTSAEIVDITDDGRTLVYTDGFTGRLGFVDISDPSAPSPLGALDLPGDPTSVAIFGRWALVAIVTSEDPDGDGPLNEYDDPAGELLVIDLATRSTVRSITLAGQPDSIAISPTAPRFAAIVIENERDEEENDGFIPQPPAGLLQVLRLSGPPHAWNLRSVSLTGLADVAPSDPEPEYVDINRKSQAVVTLQENNHIVLVDLRTARVIDHFSAGTVDLDDIDTTEEELGPQENGIIDLSESLEDRRREPDSVAWLDNDRFVTANEGDYEDEDGIEGGTRSFTVFDRSGDVRFEAGNTFEHALVRIGHYPEGRSENKGVEPEGLEVARYGGRTLLFVGSERGNAVGVYDATDDTPELLQLLPTGMGPEGIKFTRDGLLAVSSEVDGFEDGVADGFPARPIITLFSTTADSDWSYPQLQSADEDGLPIPWVAMSGLAGDPSDPDTLWAVSDSFLAQAYVYRFDVSVTPAVIAERIAIGVPDTDDQTEGEFDFEGVAARPEGGFWFASEGRTNVGSSRPNLLVRTDADGTILDTVALPAALAATANSSGFEGVAVTGTEADEDEVVWVVIQRPWPGDPANHVKVGRYDVEAEAWTFALYPLGAAPAVSGAVVGLSEISVLPDGTVAIVERDNQLGQTAAVKRIYGVDPAAVTFAPYGDPLPTLAKSLLRDALPDLDAASISIPDKLEGLGVAADGQVYLVTDNDGVDENYGETVFLRLGDWQDALAD